MIERQTSTPLSRYYAKKYSEMSSAQKGLVALAAGFSIGVVATCGPLFFVLLQAGHLPI